MAEIQQPSAPSVIRIKRKRDDAPVDSLYIERRKQKAEELTFIFKRLDHERKPSTPAIKQEYDDNGIPKIRTTPKGEEKRDPYALGKAIDQSPIRPKSKIPSHVSSEPRRFHLSGALSRRATTKGKSDVATFVERRIQIQKDIDPTGAGLDGQANVEGQQKERTFKRPTGKAKTRTAAVQITPTSPARIDASMAQQMDQWSQEAFHEEGQKTDIAASAQPQPDTDAMDVDNETDYVYDTYYRHMVAEGDVPDKGVSFGHLVIDEDQEDLWETYLDGEESDDKEFETDDEDSNAEDYYGADYPEDEVASDDEYDRDIYQYRKNADDLEEFDINEKYDSEHEEDKLARSDDENEFDSKLVAARAWRQDFGKASRSDLMSD